MSAKHLVRLRECWLGVGVVVALAGWFFFIREDNKVQQETAAVTDAVKQAAAATPTKAATAPTNAPAGSSPTTVANAPPG